jgi:hypothetical protein
MSQVIETYTLGQLSLLPLFRNLELALREYLLPLSVTDDLVATVYLRYVASRLLLPSCDGFHLRHLRGIIELLEKPTKK